MFSMDIKRAGATLLIAVPTCLIAGEYNNSNPFSAEDLEREPTLIAGSDHVPDSGDNGKPTIRITVGAPRGVQQGVELSILLPADYKIDAGTKKFAWDLSEPVTNSIRMLIIHPDETDPVYDKVIAGPHSAGIHTILADTLEKKSGYEWIMYLCEKPTCSRIPEAVARTSFSIF